MAFLLKFLARAVVAVVALAVGFVVAWVGDWVFFTAIAVVTVFALNEYYSTLHLKNIYPSARVGYVCSVLILLIAQYSENMRLALGTRSADGQLNLGDLNVFVNALNLTLLVLLFCVAGSLIAQFRNREGRSAVTNSAATVFGVVYLGLLFSFTIHLRYLNVPSLMGYQSPDEIGPRLGALLFVAGPVWACDTMAYLVGNLWGRHKLAPTISPGKTVEGAAAGLAAAIVGAVLLGWWLRIPQSDCVLLGLMMGTVGQLGDLGKSVLKRDLGIKDFGHIFGPHGGVIDRFDAILFSGPLVYWYFWFAVMRVSGS